MGEPPGKVKVPLAPPRALHSPGNGTTSSRVDEGRTQMTDGPNRILDDFARLMTDAAGAAQGVRREAETAFRTQAERVLNSMDVVQREEFEAVREMAIKAREENARLMARIEALEAERGGQTGAGSKSASGESSSAGAKATTGSKTKK